MSHPSLRINVWEKQAFSVHIMIKDIMVKEESRLQAILDYTCLENTVQKSKAQALIPIWSCLFFIRCISVISKLIDFKYGILSFIH